MYKISEFSKITHLTVKALRYYDEQGILRPSCRAENLYRYYDDHDFERAKRIALLRDLDFSIPEIREIVSSCDSPDDLSFYLREKQGMIAEQIRRDRERIEKISLCLQPTNQEAVRMEYEIERKSLKTVPVLTVRFQGRYSDVGKYIGALYHEAGGKADSAPFCCYYDDDYKEAADIELCLPTKTLLHGTQAIAKELPAADVICTTHTGSYETLNLAYKAVLDYARAHHLECLLPSREIYRKGPGMIFKGNPNRYVTEILIPVREEKQNG